MNTNSPLKKNSFPFNAESLLHYIVEHLKVEAFEYLKQTCFKDKNTISNYLKFIGVLKINVLT